MYGDFRKYLQSKIEISDAQFMEIEKLLNYKFVKRGEILLRPGEICLCGFFVMKGCLRSYVIRNSKEHIMHFAPENWWIGDNNGIIKPEPAMFYIDAVEDSSLVVYDHDFINHLGDIVPTMNEFHRTLQQNSFRSLQKRIVHLLSATAEERYLYFIEKYPNLAARLPQRMIASFLGMAPQSLSRVRSNFTFKSH
jgi:CRP-like cAMP-binding protein